MAGITEAFSNGSEGKAMSELFIVTGEAVSVTCEYLSLVS